MASEWFGHSLWGRGQVKNFSVCFLRTSQLSCLLCTLPPERTQPQKLCTANFSSGTLKTLINRLLRLKNKIFWRAPCEKKPFFSRLKSDSQKYILKWSYWPEILAPGLKSIFVNALFFNFFHFTQPLPSWQPPLKWGKGGIFAILALGKPPFQKSAVFLNIVQTGGGSTHVQKLCRKLSCVLEVI